jgi:hypothetical protein
LWPYCPAGSREPAGIRYKRDHPRRAWQSGQSFASARHAAAGGVPVEPVALELVRPGYFLPLSTVPIPLMQHVLLDELTERGWSAYERYNIALAGAHDCVAINVLGALSRKSYIATCEAAEPPTFEALRERFEEVQGDGVAIVFWVEGALAVHRTIAPELNGIVWTPVRFR